jgi:hypothetical protein
MQWEAELDSKKNPLRRIRTLPDIPDLETYSYNYRNTIYSSIVIKDNIVEIEQNLNP